MLLRIKPLATAGKINLHKHCGTYRLKKKWPWKLYALGRAGGKWSVFVELVCWFVEMSQTMEARAPLWGKRECRRNASNCEFIPRLYGHMCVGL